MKDAYGNALALRFTIEVWKDARLCSLFFMNKSLIVSPVFCKYTAARDLQIQK